MKFALRDDDTNFFTSSQDLEEAYSNIWEICPVTLFIVPFIMGNWKRWTKERHCNYNEVNIDEYKNDKTIFPIGENKELISYLKNKIKEGKVEIGIHGIHHRNTDKTWPKIKHNRGENAEFYTQQDLTKKLSEAKYYLENTFEQKINVFSPPQNLINSIGFNAVLNNNLSIVRNRNTKKIIENSSEIGVLNSIKILNHSIRKKISQKSIQYPSIIKYHNFSEISHYPFQPSTKIENLRSNIKLTVNENGIFILSTHYYALQKSFDPSLNMKNSLLEILLEISSANNIEFMGINTLIQSKTIE